MDRTENVIPSNLPPTSVRSYSSLTVKPAQSSTTTQAPAESSGSVTISNIDLQAEVVTITNDSSKPVELSGWKLVSEKGNQTYNFLSDTIIPANGTIKVESGKNAQVGTNILVWIKENIWNNDGDPGALCDAQGTVVSEK